MDKNPFKQKTLATNDLTSSTLTPAVKKCEIKKISTEIDDNIFLNVLKRDKPIIKKEEKIEIIHEKRKIYKNVRVFSTEKLQIDAIKYYKFPFDYEHKDIQMEKFLFEWRIAFKNIYKRFRENCTNFMILFMNELVVFKDKKASVNVNLSDTLNKNEIVYEKINNELIVKGVDVALLFDLIINMECGKNYPIPFILCKKEFENGIMFHTKVKRPGIVQCKGEVKYCYEIDGYFYGEDYCEYFNNDTVFDTI